MMWFMLWVETRKQLESESINAYIHLFISENSISLSERIYVCKRETSTYLSLKLNFKLSFIFKMHLKFEKTSFNVFVLSLKIVFMFHVLISSTGWNLFFSSLILLDIFLRKNFASLKHETGNLASQETSFRDCSMMR